MNERMEVVVLLLIIIITMGLLLLADNGAPPSLSMITSCAGGSPNRRHNAHVNGSGNFVEYIWKIVLFRTLFGYRY